MEEVDRELEDPTVWENQDRAQALGKERASLESVITLLERIDQSLTEASELAKLAEEEEDKSAFRDIKDEVVKAEKEVERLEFRRMFSDEMDANSAYLDVQAGSGGTEAQDWAEMLARAYLRWGERREFKAEIIEWQPGEEAGGKAATITVAGNFAYGLLLAEAGVHRLVRISPFDQASRRHTSFASVYVWPELPDDVDIEVDEKDLRIDTYRSSGAGGQHVNVTDSAVLITHLPTNIVVSCQNERSQHRNRDAAMKVLKAKLYDKKLQEQQEKLEAIGGEKKAIDFGSQIRNYVLHPYQMVKDLRTQMETGNVERVLDGDFDPFIKAYLMNKAGGATARPADS